MKKEIQKNQKKFISIKTKLIGIIIPVVTIIIVVLTVLFYTVSKNVIESDAHENLKSSVESQAEEIEAWLEQNLTSFNVEKQAIERMGFDEEQLQKFLDAYYKFDSNYAGGLYIADMNGTLYKAQESQMADKDLLQTVWFKEGLTRVDMGFTDAYTNQEGEQVISACGMLRTYTDDVRVLSVDLPLDRISVCVNSFIKMQDAEAFLVNEKDNTIFTSRDKNLISKKLSDTDNKFLQKVGKEIEKKDFDLKEIDGNMTAFEEVEGTDWILVSYIPTEIVYKDLNTVRNMMILFGIISMLILAVIIERSIHVVINPVKKLTNAIKKMTDGDFRIRIHTKSNDEIGVMSRCVEKFIATMHGMIASINGVSDTLHIQADSSNDVSGKMFQASKMQNESMKELNTTVEQMTISVNQIAQSATTLAMVVAETRDTGKNVNEKMQETVDVSEKGKDNMQDVSVAMQNMDSSMEKLQLAINEVGRASEEITNITKVIGDIADETNLLALNASIEAARAGEAGKGFTVVAAEIGKLAQTSMESVQHIDKLVLEIKTSVGDVMHQASESMNNIGDSNTLIGNALTTFDVVFENIVGVGEMIQQMIEKVERVDDVARNVAAISEEQAASTEEILASTDTLVEQASSLMEDSGVVANEAKELTTSADNLATQVGVFKIEN